MIDDREQEQIQAVLDVIKADRWEPPAPELPRASGNDNLHPAFRPNWWAAGFMIAFFAALFILLVRAALAGEAITGTATVKDGDDVIVDGQDYRFLGVDAFEPGQTCRDDKGELYDCGASAKAALENIVGSRTLECIPTKHDGERLIANCTAEGEDIQVMMARSGWGFVRPDFLKSNPARVAELCDAEREAQANKQGAWIGTFDIPWSKKGGGKGRKQLADVSCPATYKILVAATPQPSETVDPPTSEATPEMDDRHLPQWVEYLQALSTPAIALLALVIGWTQWRTAHQRAVLDLFDRRMELYDGISRVMSEIVSTGTVPNEIVMAFTRATSRVELLFGPEVKAYLGEMNKTLAAHHVAEAREAHGTPEERQLAMDRRHAAFLKIASFFDDFPKLVRPYVRMHQKAPRF